MNDMCTVQTSARRIASLLCFSGRPGRPGHRLVAGLGVCLAMLAVSLPLAAQAQDFGQVRETDTNIDSYYYFVQPGEATVQVEVVGTVRSPGLYLIGEGSDLGDLLALSGGATLDVRQRSQARTVILRLYRPSGSGRDNLIYETELQNGALTEADPYPDLRTGDIVTVEVVERRRFVWRDIFTIINTAGIVIFAVDRFF